MNVKVKMPHFKGVKKTTSMGKELLMSVVGTTISILLTFGTAYFIEQHQRKAEGRDVAMMVIHDIDLYAEHFRELAAEDQANHDMAMLVMEHLDDIESFPLDTIQQVLSYIMYEKGNDARYDESIEKTFQSNQEIWRSIDAPLFIDQARAFFHNRRLNYQTLNTSTAFKKPMNRDELDQLYATSLKAGKKLDLHGFLREKLQQGDVVMFLEFYVQRQPFLNDIADQFQAMSNRCKFIMEITDEELEAFLAKRQQVGEPLTDHKLIGQWQTMDDQPQTYEFNRDHTFKQIAEKVNVSSVYQGRLKVIYTYTGRWEIKGDSLYRHFNAGCDLKLDSSGITYSAEMRDTVERILKLYEQKIADFVNKNRTQAHDDIVRAAAIDHSGNKVELCPHENSSDSEVTYIVRSK